MRISQTVHAVVLLLATASLSACAQEQRSVQQAPVDDTPCNTLNHVAALPDSFVLQSRSLPEHVSAFYNHLDTWRKLPLPDGYTPEDTYREMKDTLTDEKLMLELKGLYGALDPGSMAFHSFLATGKRELDIYPREPAWYYKTLRYVAEERLGPSPLFMLAFADGIYEIKIASIDQSSFDRGSEAKSSPRYDTLLCVVGNVLDTIKGAWLLGSCGPTEKPGAGTDRKCLNFTVRTRMGTVKGERTVFDHPYQTFYGDFRRPKVGDRYLVFAQMDMTPSKDDKPDRYNIFPMSELQYEGGMFLIRDGKVHDSTNFFGLGTTPDVETLKARLRSIIAEKLLP